MQHPNKKYNIVISITYSKKNPPCGKKEYVFRCGMIALLLLWQMS